MLWFKRKKEQVKQDERAKQVSVEVRQHKNKSKKVMANTQKVSDNLNKLLRENGITIKISLATGGKRH